MNSAKMHTLEHCPREIRIIALDFPASPRDQPASELQLSSALQLASGLLDFCERLSQWSAVARGRATSVPCARQGADSSAGQD